MTISEKIPAVMVFWAALVLACPSLSALEQSMSGELKDAWLTGKAETVLALNQHLNRYSVGARVESGVVTLTGTVGSDIARSLATELMKGIAEIRSVRNRLRVDPELDEQLDEEQASSHNSFARWIDDLTITAIVRSRLLRHSDVSGLDIEVDTTRNVVTLKGKVESMAESALAEELTRNTNGVTEVRNRLLITEATQLSGN